MNNDHLDNNLDRQVRNLAENLREKGTTPRRDLWPDIDAALDQVDQARTVRRSTGGGRVWRVAALAATLILVVGLGFVGTLKPGDQPRQLTALETPGSEESLSTMASLDRALGELNEALRMDPENRHLSRLVLLVHKSRADVLRQNTQNL